MNRVVQLAKDHPSIAFPAVGALVVDLVLTFTTLTDRQQGLIVTIVTMLAGVGVWHRVTPVHRIPAPPPPLPEPPR